MCLPLGGENPKDKADKALANNEMVSLARRMTTLELKELNERQRAEHAHKMYEQMRNSLRQVEERNLELEAKFAEVWCQRKRPVVYFFIPRQASEISVLLDRFFFFPLLFSPKAPNHARPARHSGCRNINGLVVANIKKTHCHYTYWLADVIVCSFANFHHMPLTVSRSFHLTAFKDHPPAPALTHPPPPFHPAGQVERGGPAGGARAQGRAGQQRQQGGEQRRPLQDQSAGEGGGGAPRRGFQVRWTLRYRSLDASPPPANTASTVSKANKGKAK